jgi:hypothetical protein
MGRPGTAPPVWPPEVAGGEGACVRLEKGLFVVVIVVGVVMLLGDSPLATPPHPAAKTSKAALPHNVIAFLPL